MTHFVMFDAILDRIFMEMLIIIFSKLEFMFMMSIICNWGLLVVVCGLYVRLGSFSCFDGPVDAIYAKLRILTLCQIHFGDFDILSNFCWSILNLIFLSRFCHVCILKVFRDFGLRKF